MKIARWGSRGTTAPLLLLAVVTLGTLAPFLDKAIHMDDPLFVWSARQISSHPLDFYGFNVNWDGHTASMASLNENPPLCSYYLAMIGSVLGWSEIALHTGFLFAALATVFGTYFLARRLCSHPVWAGLALAVSPGFLLCSSSLMCDTLMLALWTWSVFFWVKGLSEERIPLLALAAIFVSAAVLTKYFACSLVPLLAVYSWLERRRWGAWLGWLALPVLVLGCFHGLTVHLYGQSLVTRAILYATHLRVGGQLPSKLLAGFAFAGGCFIPVAVTAPWLWGRKQLLAGIGAVLLVGSLVVVMKQVGQASLIRDHRVNWLLVFQLALLSVCGASLLCLAGADWLNRTSADSALLFLWVGGTLVFTCAVNWTVSGRNILPSLPAASILLVRRLELREARSGRTLPSPAVWIPLAVSLALALMVTHVDSANANSVRLAASTLTEQLSGRVDRVKFEGHWGFQYYMQAHGAVPLERPQLQLSTNEAVVVPVGNSYLFPLSPQQVEPWLGLRCQNVRWLAVMNVSCGAGFYSDGWGPLPFAFGPVPLDDYLVYRAKSGP